MSSAQKSTNAALGEVAAVFLKLGLIAFGGPAAHIAMMRDEVVRRRRWVSDQEFLDLLGATNLIPGPNSTEMAIHLGYRRAGPRGLVLAGMSFIAPAMLIVLAFAWAYVRFGATPAAQWLLYGIKPVIIAVIVQALWSLGRTAVRSVLLAVVGLVVLTLYLRGVNEIALLVASGLTVMVALNVRALRTPHVLLPAVLGGSAGGLVSVAAIEVARAPFTLGRLFLIFLKIGAVLYGSGYVLLAFLRGDFVLRLGWLTDRQLLDAIAIGQFTPGPVFTTATFIGYILGGVPAALLATAGIFLPSFVFVAASHPFIPRMRKSPWAGALLDGVNIGSLALMAGVTAQLTRTAVVDLATLGVALTALVLLARFRVNSVWLVAGGAAVGWLAHAL